MSRGVAATPWNFGSSETFPLRNTQPAPLDPLPITTPLALTAVAPALGTGMSVVAPVRRSTSIALVGTTFGNGSVNDLISVVTT